ncbi:TetR family transcriptional regulator [Microterricola gilva]|uniref:TetR family transcriptional regulator n=1 Tax=Microterricola gilva TaxID=393267 RepID=A0A4V2GB76_9MICO|nr:TetR/AcrR family transcriptional regulator [Microterricola gilva]RZU67066.1 TetR family transcriptional regulator [Microterricola gilva]
MSDERTTRRRGEALTAAIRAATAAELAEHGYAGVSFEGVARRAQTSKPVLYRRYHSRAHLVIDAWAALAPLALPTHGSGSLSGDLRGVLHAIDARFQRVGIDAFRRVIAEADDELLEEITRFTWAAATDTIALILHEARDRGELGPAPIPERVMLLPLVLLRHELFFTRGALTPDAVAEMVDQVCVPLLIATSNTELPL